MIIAITNSKKAQTSVSGHIGAADLSRPVETPVVSGKMRKNAAPAIERVLVRSHGSTAMVRVILRNGLLRNAPHLQRYVQHSLLPTTPPHLHQARP
jgi:hypothetical protein